MIERRHLLYDNRPDEAREPDVFEAVGAAGTISPKEAFEVADRAGLLTYPPRSFWQDARRERTASSAPGEPRPPDRTWGAALRDALRVPSANRTKAQKQFLTRLHRPAPLPRESRTTAATRRALVRSYVGQFGSYRLQQRRAETSLTWRIELHASAAAVGETGHARIGTGVQVSPWQTLVRGAPAPDAQIVRALYLATARAASRTRANAHGPSLTQEPSAIIPEGRTSDEVVLIPEQVWLVLRVP